MGNKFYFVDVNWGIKRDRNNFNCIFLKRSNKNNEFCNIIHRVFKRDMVKINFCQRHVKKRSDCKYLLY